MKITDNQSLRSMNSFGIDVYAEKFAVLSSRDELAGTEIFSEYPKVFVLGGGSNILLTGNVSGLVIKNDLKGISLVAEDDHYVYVTVGAGENWHGLVEYCLGRGWAGVENLALIPGNVGASPMQNIGAYGVEIKDVFQELEAYEIETGRISTFSLNDCEFGYRDSVFKRRFKDQFIILSVTYRLNKIPRLNTSYGAITEELNNMGIKDPGIRDVANAVIRIRQSKLPDPAVIGNAGSFFKNPQVPQPVFDALHLQFPDIIGFPQEDATVKLAAGRLIEKCGWKGVRRGGAGCYDKQALVLVNYGNASGKDVYDLSTEILESVYEKFGIMLDREVNLVK